MKLKSGLWKLSPSSLYSYVECQSCFWAENHHGRHPFTLPLRLNQAMDVKFKHRYDQFRKQGTLPPELKDLKGYRLFNDSKILEDWRTKTTSLAYTNEQDGYMLSGKLDEVFVNERNELIPADYKSSGDPPKEDKYKYYVLQLHAYAQMIKDKGYEVADEAYLLHYFPKHREDPSLNVELAFHCDRVELSLVRFLESMRAIVNLLDSPFPGSNPDCRKCVWLKKRNTVSNKIIITKSLQLDLGLTDLTEK